MVLYHYISNNREWPILLSDDKTTRSGRYYMASLIEPNFGDKLYYLTLLINWIRNEHTFHSTCRL